MNISIITTCKSRLEHLKTSIESWKYFNPAEIIVVDVSCPDKTSKWLSEFHPDVRSINIESQSFNLAHARNVGAKNAQFDYLFFVDADIILGQGLNEWFAKHVDSQHYYSRVQDTPFEGIHEQGTFLCHKLYFNKVMGYDETFNGYGGEDHDMYYKLKRIGISKVGIPKDFIKSLDHQDEKRTEHYTEKNKFKQSVLNRSYSALKEKLLELNPIFSELPQELRNQLWHEVRSKIKPEYDNLEGYLTTVKTSSQKWLPDPYFLDISVQISISIKRRL
jgi:glycosyltransferase involved in cell wall biosynthesis